MAQAEQYDVFLSYRRDGGVKDAMLIKLALENRGYRVFFDLGGLGAGTFGRQLHERIDECRDFVLIVSPHALDRCVNERDWLRLEIEYAHEKEKNIVPVLIDINRIPDNLPTQINFIQELQSLKFSFDFFNHYNFFETFIDTVSAFLKSESVPTPSSTRQMLVKKTAFVPGKDNVLMEDIENAYLGGMAFSTTLSRDEIKTITFLDTLADVPTNTWDLSAKCDGSVLGWVRSRSDGLYDLYIAGAGGVSAPRNCSELFGYYCEVTSIDFGGVFYTDRAVSFSGMFEDCKKLFELDLSSFHTGNVIDMAGMFAGCENLFLVNVSGFDTSKVIDMTEMFFQCDSLRSLDVSSFNFSHVKEYDDFMPDSLDPNWERYFTR